MRTNKTDGALEKNEKELPVELIPKETLSMKIYKYVREHPYTTRRKILNHFGVADRSLRRGIELLTEKGYIKKIECDCDPSCHIKKLKVAK